MNKLKKIVTSILIQGFLLLNSASADGLELAFENKAVNSTLSPQLAIDSNAVINLYDIYSQKRVLKDNIVLPQGLISSKDVLNKATVISRETTNFKIGNNNFRVPPYLAGRVARLHITAFNENGFEFQKMGIGVGRRKKTIAVVLVDLNNPENQLIVLEKKGEVIIKALDKAVPAETIIFGNKAQFDNMERQDSFLERSDLGIDFLNRVLGIGELRSAKPFEVVTVLKSLLLSNPKLGKDIPISLAFFSQDYMLTFSEGLKKHSEIMLLRDREQRGRFIAIVDRLNPDNRVVFERRGEQIYILGAKERVIIQKISKHKKTQVVYFTDIEEGANFCRNVTRKLLEIPFADKSNSISIRKKVQLNVGVYNQNASLLKVNQVTQATVTGYQIKQRVPEFIEQTLATYPLYVLREDFKRDMSVDEVDINYESSDFIFYETDEQKSWPEYLSFGNAKDALYYQRLSGVYSREGKRYTVYRVIQQNDILTYLSFSNDGSFTIKGINWKNGSPVAFRNVGNIALSNIVTQLMVSRFISIDPVLLEYFNLADFDTGFNPIRSTYKFINGVFEQGHNIKMQGVIDFSKIQEKEDEKIEENKESGMGKPFSYDGGQKIWINKDKSEELPIYMSCKENEIHNVEFEIEVNIAEDKPGIMHAVFESLGYRDDQGELSLGRVRINWFELADSEGKRVLKLGGEIDNSDDKGFTRLYLAAEKLINNISEIKRASRKSINSTKYVLEFDLENPQLLGQVTEFFLNPQGRSHIGWQNERAINIRSFLTPRISDEKLGLSKFIFEIELSDDAHKIFFDSIHGKFFSYFKENAEQKKLESYLDYIKDSISVITQCSIRCVKIEKGDLVDSMLNEMIKDITKFKENSFLLERLAAGKDKLRKALDVVADLNLSRARRNKTDPLISHQIEIAQSLANIFNFLTPKVLEYFEKFIPNAFETILTAVILHDAVEDGDISREDLRRDFGENVYEIVDLLTIADPDDEIAYYRKLSARKDAIGRLAQMIKIADKYHNISTLAGLDSKAKRKNFFSCLDIFIPELIEKIEIEGRELEPLVGVFEKSILIIKEEILEVGQELDLYSSKFRPYAENRLLDSKGYVNPTQFESYWGSVPKPEEMNFYQEAIDKIILNLLHDQEFLKQLTFESKKVKWVNTLDGLTERLLKKLSYNDGEKYRELELKIMITENVRSDDLNERLKVVKVLEDYVTRRNAFNDEDISERRSLRVSLSGDVKALKLVEESI